MRLQRATWPLPHSRAHGGPRSPPAAGASRRWLLGALAAGSFVLAVGLSATVFRHLSQNVDEGVYLSQARTLLDGHLTLPAEQAGSHQPFFTGVRGDRLVYKYPPVWPAVLAAAEMAGSARLALGLTAAGAVVAAYGFAREVTGDRRQALVAAALVGSSPTFVVHAASFVPYVFSLGCNLAFGWALLSGLAARSRLRLVVAGAALGVGLFARPFDAVLFALPVAVYAARATASLGWWAVARVAAGAAPFVVATLAFDAAVMGSPLRLPFGVTDPLDALGFGPRRVYPGVEPLDYGPSEALAGMVASLRLLPRWVAGGPLFLAAAAWGLARRSGGRRRAGLVVALGAAAPVGYLFFWGAYNAAVLLHAYDRTGPFYYLPVLVPLAIAAAPVVASALDRPRRAALGALGALAVTVAAVAEPVGWHLADARRLDAVYRPLRAAERAGPALVLLPALRGPYLLHPFRTLANAPDLSGPVVYAVSRAERDVDLLAGSARTPWRLAPTAVAEDQVTAARLDRLSVREAASLELRYRVVNTAGERVVATYAVVGGAVLGPHVLDASSTRGAAYDVAWRLGAAAGATLASPPGAGSAPAAPLPAAGTFAVAATFGATADLAAATERVEQRHSYRVRSGRVAAVLPGEGWRRPRGQPAWSPADVGPALSLVRPRPCAPAPSCDAPA